MLEEVYVKGVMVPVTVDVERPLVLGPFEYPMYGIRRWIEFPEFDELMLTFDPEIAPE